MTHPDFEGVKKKLELLKARQKEAYDLYKQQSDLCLSQLNLLRSICHHPDVSNQQVYTRGGYDYMGRTEYWTTCNVCGLSSDSVFESDGSYA